MNGEQRMNGAQQADDGQQDAAEVPADAAGCSECWRGWPCPCEVDEDLWRESRGGKER